MPPARWLLVALFTLSCSSGNDDGPTPFASLIETGTTVSTAMTGLVSTGSTGSTGDTGDETGPRCFEQDAVDQGQVVITESDVSLLSNFAISTSEPGPTEPLPTGFFVDAGYYGAVDPAVPSNWAAGWTARHPDIDGSLNTATFHPLELDILDGTIVPAFTSSCAAFNFADGAFVTVFGATFPVCLVSGEITTSMTWPNNHVFFLTDLVTVGDGDEPLNGSPPPTNVTLTIQEGTQVYGAPGATGLVVTRGSTLVAQGTAALPVVFASVPGTIGIIGDPTDLTSRGAWAGITLSGQARTNQGDATGEAPTDYGTTFGQRYYGGLSDDDSSGTLQYVVIAEAGFEVQAGLPSPGLMLEAVGSGTALRYIQILGSEGDCVTALGGAARLRWLVCNGPEDDGLDLAFGYRGAVQFGLFRMGALNGHRALELDNDSQNFENTPATQATLANLTVLGNRGTDSVNTQAAMHRAGDRSRVFRTVFVDDDPGQFETGCIEIDDVLPAELQYRDTLVDCAAGAFAACEE